MYGTYAVYIDTIGYEEQVINLVSQTFRQQYQEKNGEDLEEALAKKYGTPISITLRSGDSGFDLSNRRNEFEVYNKVIACVHQYITKHKPIILVFSGYTPEQDILYEKLIKLSNKLWPENAYVSISDRSSGTYIRKEVHEDFLSDEKYMSRYATIAKTRETFLNYARRDKTYQRNKKLNQP